MTTGDLDHHKHPEPDVRCPVCGNEDDIKGLNAGFECLECGHDGPHEEFEVE